MVSEDIFLESSVEDLIKGYVFDKETNTYECLICHHTVEKGCVYPYGDHFFEAERAMMQHIKDEHESMFDYFIHLNKRFTGLSEQQSLVLQLFYRGLSDKEIAEQVEGISSISTVRQYRFKLKEKLRQAKTFLALMSLLEANAAKVNEELMPVHKGATMVDDRYVTTKEEQEKFIGKYFNADGTLKEFPKKEKRKIIILKELLKRHFETDKRYTEKEVNAIIKPIYSDFVTIRRYFIEYGFLDRTRDGSSYWVK